MTKRPTKTEMRRLEAENAALKKRLGIREASFLTLKAELEEASARVAVYESDNQFLRRALLEGLPSELVG